jgi:hypothetical protein
MACQLHNRGLDAYDGNPLTLADSPLCAAAWYQHMGQDLLAAGNSMQDINAMLMGQNRVPRDWKVTIKDIRNVVGAEFDEVVRLDPDDAASVDRHARESACTFVYRPQIMENEKQTQSFAWGFNTSPTLAALLEYGHEQPVILDSTFGTNKYMVSCFFVCGLGFVPFGKCQLCCVHAVLPFHHDGYRPPRPR